MSLSFLIDILLLVFLEPISYTILIDFFIELYREREEDNRRNKKYF